MQEQMEMAFMQEGGLQDDGAVLDAVSGNEVPSGSMDQEVRDDVPAMLSEGEYVVPADVVRYHGVKLFEQLRDEAKMGMGEMEQDGRIGGEPMGDPMEDELPFDISELQTVEEPVREMAEGGEVGPTFTYNPNTRYMQRQNTTSGFDMRVYINPATGRQITIPFFNGQPMSTIPEGFVLASDQTAAQQTTAQPQMQQQRRRSGDSPFGQPDAPTQRGFDAFTTEDWANYAQQADSSLSSVTANIPILGTLQRLSESSARNYAKKAIETGKHPATGETLTSAEITALTRVMNMAERKSIFDSIGDFLKGEPEVTTEDLTAQPVKVTELDESDANIKQLYGDRGFTPEDIERDRQALYGNTDTSNLSSSERLILEQKEREAKRRAGTSDIPRGTQYASSDNILTDAYNILDGEHSNLYTDPRNPFKVRIKESEGDFGYQVNAKNDTLLSDSPIPTAYEKDGVRYFIPYKDGIDKATGRQLWSVGFGHQLRGDELNEKGEPVNNAWTEEQCNIAFEKDIAIAWSHMPRVINPSRHPPEIQEAIAEMIFQMGVGNYKDKTGVLGFHNMIDALAKGDYERAGREARNSQWFNETETRAERVASVIESGRAILQRNLNSSDPLLAQQAAYYFQDPSIEGVKGIGGLAPIDIPSQGQPSVLSGGASPDMRSRRGTTVQQDFVPSLAPAPQFPQAQQPFTPITSGQMPQANVSKPLNAIPWLEGDDKPLNTIPDNFYQSVTPQGSAGLLPQANVPTDMSGAASGLSGPDAAVNQIPQVYNPQGWQDPSQVPVGSGRGRNPALWSLEGSGRAGTRFGQNPALWSLEGSGRGTNPDWTNIGGDKIVRDANWNQYKYDPDPSAPAGPDFDPNAVDIDTTRTAKYYGGGPDIIAPEYYNRVSDLPQMTNVVQGPDTNRFAPEVQPTNPSAMQGEYYGEKYYSTDPLIIDPSRHDPNRLYKGEGRDPYLNEAQLGSDRAIRNLYGDRQFKPEDLQQPILGKSWNYQLPSPISTDGGVPFDAIDESIDAQTERVFGSAGLSGPDAFENQIRNPIGTGRDRWADDLSIYQDRLFPFGTPRDPYSEELSTRDTRRALSKTELPEGKDAVEKSDVNTAVQDAMGKDEFGRYTDIRKEQRRIGAGLSEGDKVKELQREASIRYNINRAKEWGIDPSKMKKEYFDAKGNFKPPKNAPKEILDLKATGISGTGIKVKGHHSPPSKKDPIIPSIVTKPTDESGNIITKADKAWQKKLKEKNVSADAFKAKKPKDTYKKDGKTYYKGGRATGGLVKRRATKKKNT